MSTWSILLSGGSGSRMGCAGNKTLLPLLGESAVCHALRTLKRHSEGVVMVIRPQDEKDVKAALAQSGLAVDKIVYGGADRQQSVFNGLMALPEDCDIVLVHDGARPLIDDQTVQNVIASVIAHGSGIASTPVTDTFKQVDAQNVAIATPDRNFLRAVQTPQGFKKELLLRAHREVSDRCTDDAALVSALGVPVYLCEGSRRNIKLTTPEDILMAEHYLHVFPRIGHGFDAHRLVEGRKLILGGVEIPYEKGLLGHSDADVLLHAITDALLGAAALGDIGKHFPDSDPKYKGISSLLLLEAAVKLMHEKGFEPLNIDATVLCQRPKLAPHIPTMRENIARACGLPLDCVSVKATTTEGMGYEGDGSGISTHAVALLKSFKQL